MKNLKATLSSSSLNTLSRNLSDYTKRIDEKVNRARREIALLIAVKAEQGFNRATVNSYTSLYGPSSTPANVVVDCEDVGVDTTVIRANGEEVAFVEFGAGVFFNGSAGSSPHPKGGELGLTIGSYGKGHGKQAAWGFNDSDGFHITRGTPAQMPFYKAFLEVREDIVALVRKEFSTW